MVTHIPNGERTNCGRPVAAVKVINVDRDCIEDATCKTCQRSDDRRTRELARREAKHPFKASAHFSDCCDVCGESESHGDHVTP